MTNDTQKDDSNMIKLNVTATNVNFVIDTNIIDFVFLFLMTNEAIDVLVFTRVFLSLFCDIILSS